MFSKVLCVVIRVFNAFLQTLYDFALKCKDIPQSYALATNYPRKVLQLGDNGGPLLEDLGLGKKCVVFVQDLTEDDDD